MEKKMMINKDEEVKVEQQMVGGGLFLFWQTAPLRFLPCLDCGSIWTIRVVSDHWSPSFQIQNLRSPKTHIFLIPTCVPGHEVEEMSHLRKIRIKLANVHNEEESN